MSDAAPILGTLAADGFYEIRPADYRGGHPLEETNRVHAIIQRSLDEGRPYRLILEEAKDLAHPLGNPLEPFEYRLGPEAIFICSEETVIHLKNGRRYLIRRGDRGHNRRGYA